MRAWSRRHTLIAGVALILATNTLALVGVAYNRAGEPDSSLQLTQRELALPYAWDEDSDNSGIALTLQWRVLQAHSDDSRDSAMSYAGRGVPEWLDTNKLAQLGFDLPQPFDEAHGVVRHWRPLPKEVLLVLELNGPAYQQALQGAREHAGKEAGLAAANPGNEEFERRARSAREELDREEKHHTRLFVVDAGVDAASLRATYPDRTRYAIVRGQVRPFVAEAADKPRVGGYMTASGIEAINVPHAFRPIFEPLLELDRTPRPDSALRYMVSVAFGIRFEPWITDASDAQDTR